MFTFMANELARQKKLLTKLDDLENEMKFWADYIQ